MKEKYWSEEKIRKTGLLHLAVVLAAALISLKAGEMLQDTLPLSVREAGSALPPALCSGALYLFYKSRWDLSEYNLKKGFSRAAGALYIFEEVIFRGLFQNMMCHLLKKKNRIYPVAASSLVFALLHLLNLTENPQFLLGTLTQVGYTFCLGMLLGTAYLISDSLWAVILLHGGFNFLGQFVSVFQTGGQQPVQGDIPLSAMVIQIAVMLPCIWIALKIRKRNFT
ncbi:hypothetical protein B5F53_00390 [Blautia sp. An249]|uniref:CPBP family intramembrane glutamic endopeptidase n=1 Tax=Blautia sp. An249 TaxID=1965603 RepID=UPI000B398099|nr:CPBP family intramembrane glutamic endopeptidase [Blautia sp. An249]OUO81073.1 hypothetical protein B5F53_00390 [Blautia sp. An249]